MANTGRVVVSRLASSLVPRVLPCHVAPGVFRRFEKKKKNMLPTHARFTQTNVSNSGIDAGATRSTRKYAVSITKRNHAPWATARRMRMARGAVVDVGERMLAWQARLSAHLRRRCVRRAGKTGFVGWRETVVGSRRQRRMLVKGASAWVRSRMRRDMTSWRENARTLRAQGRALRQATRRMANRKLFGAFRRWRESSKVWPRGGAPLA